MIGITGSIAAYKIPFLVRLLVREGAVVQIIMTPKAADFITPLTLSTLSQRPVIIDAFKTGTGEWNNHVELGQWADLMVFAPVTANTLGKMVNGIADNFVVTAYLSAKCPVFIAPAMDLDMYQHPSTKRNIEVLSSYGNRIIEPQVGELASGLTGPGRMEEPQIIVEIIKDHFSKQSRQLKKKVLITAGPTHENIDPVRFISNKSTGKMGFSLANEAARRGADVTLITGPTHLVTTRPGIHTIRVENAAQMHEECMKTASQSDIIIMAAAVGDYTPAAFSKSKIKKKSAKLTLELLPTPDILKAIGQQKTKNQILVGFALETDQEIENAQQKLKDKRLDFIVLNSLKDEGAGFGHDTNKVTIIDRYLRIHQGVLKSKDEVASDIIDLISGG